MRKSENRELFLEMEKTFQVLKEGCSAPDSLEYFFSLAKRYFEMTKSCEKKEVLILGTSFPEELLRANRILPHWVIGGSLSLGMEIDSKVPRDADAVSRSILGYLARFRKEIDPEIPVLIPVIGDNFRKLAYLVKEEGGNVITMDIAPWVRQEERFSSIVNQLESIMGDLSPFWEFPGENRKLIRGVREVEQAKAVLRTILYDPTVEMKGMLKLFLANTYFYAENLEEWSGHLKTLAEKLYGEDHPSGSQKPGVLIIGSPILFPNYKVPMLLESCGLEILGACSSLTGKVSAGMNGIPEGSRKDILYAMAENTYGTDCSGAYVSNHPLYRQAEHMLDSMDVQGVIFHIIKGQIEYDFELDQMDGLFSERKIPVFRLETDYHDNDIEQLRIRLEAFSELLIQDRIRNEKVIK